MNIRFIKTRSVLAKFTLFLGFAGIILLCASTVSNLADAKSQTQGLSEDQLSEDKLNEFAQNNILFYNPGECIASGESGTACGNTAREKYWSVLSKYYDDPIQLSGIIGNLHDEGDFNPVSWQCYNGIDENGHFVSGDWNYYYNLDSDVGVGAFGITSGLDTYLHYINNNYPDLIKYFQNPEEYSFNYCYSDGNYKYDEYTHTYGDELLEKIGDANFDKLVEAEVKYAIENFKPGVSNDYKKTNFSTPTEASNYWAEYWEVCGGHTGDECLVPYSQSPAKQERARYAEKTYDDFENYTCNTSSTSSSFSSSSSPSGSISGSDITWIGDSYSENSTNKATVEAKYPGIYYDGQSGRKFADDDERWGPSGLNIIKNDIKGNLRDYLVFALGTNTDTVRKDSEGSKDSMAKNIDDLVTTAKKYNNDTKIILVSPITNNDSDRSTYDAYRKAMQEAVAKYDNVILADWYDVAKDHLDEYFDDHVSDGYTDNFTHPNTKGYQKWIDTINAALLGASARGCTTYEGDYPEYLQKDSKWGSEPYGPKGSGKTIANSGCGAASMAMLATVATGQDIFPDDVARLLDGNYYYNTSDTDTSNTGMNGLDKKVCAQYGCEVEVVPYNTENIEDKIREYLKKGYMIHLTGACADGGSNSDTCPYSSGGHYIGIYKLINDNTVLVADSAGGVREFALHDVGRHLNPGNFSAIRGSSSNNKNTCATDDYYANYCSTGSTVAISGLTEEQAQKLADYYNGPDVDANEWGLNRKTNCTSFSQWFVEALTSHGKGGTWPDGRHVAHTLAVESDLNEGREPRPFSVFSVTRGSWDCTEPDGTVVKCGHTGIVVAVNDDEVLTVEAGWPSTPAYVGHKSLDYFENTLYGNTFTYINSILNSNDLYKIVGK